MSLLATWMFRCRSRTQTGLPFDSVMSVLAKISSFYHTRDDPDRALSLHLAMGITESMLYEPVRAGRKGHTLTKASARQGGQRARRVGRRKV